MKKNIIHAPLFRVLVPIPYGALVYLLLLLINNNLLIIGESFISAELFFCIGLSYVVIETNRLSIALLFKKVSFSSASMVAQILLNVIITFAMVYGSLLGYFILFLGYSSLTGFSTEVMSFNLFFGITSILYNLLAISYNLLTAKNEQLFNNEAILKEQVEFELENYQAQVNPDLLFESLESAITLIHQNTEEAEDFIDHLALAYRYILSNQHNESASLQKEVEATLNLLRLHNVRHKGMIKFDNKATEVVGELIPGSIPLLVDEIIKSTIISEARPLVITLGTEGNYLTLSYKINDRLNKNSHELITFERLHKAYSYYTEDSLVKVFAYGDAFYKIPLLNLTETAA